MQIDERYHWDHRPVSIDSNNELERVDFNGQRYLGVEIELEFDTDEFGMYDEDNPDYQEEIEVYMRDYDEYITIDNPHFRYPEDGPVNRLIDDYENPIDKNGINTGLFEFKTDGSLENGVEIVLEPISFGDWDRLISSEHFDIAQELYDLRWEYNTEKRCGVHISVTNLHGFSTNGKKEINKIEYILWRLGYDLSDLTRNSRYARWFHEYYDSEIRLLIDMVQTRYSINGGDYRCVRDNTDRHEFRFFNVPEYDLRGTLIKYGHFIEQVMDLCDKYTLMDLVLSDLYVDSLFNLDIGLHNRYFDLSQLSSDAVLELSI